jgi:hypothetical protein
MDKNHHYARRKTAKASAYFHVAVLSQFLNELIKHLHLNVAKSRLQNPSATGNSDKSVN